MSGHHFFEAWEYSKASGSALLVLMALSEVAGRDDLASLDQREIATRARMNVSTVATAISRLKELGEIEVVEEASGRRAAIYRINLPLDHEFTRSSIVKEIPTGPHTSSEISNLASEEDDEGPDGEEGGDSLPPEDAPVSPVAGGGTFEIYRPSEPEAPKEPRPKRIVPSHLPPTDVGAVLAALGVKPDARGPLFWWRQEHNDALTAALDALGLPDADALIERIKESGTKVEALNSLRDLAGMRF